MWSKLGIVLILFCSALSAPTWALAQTESPPWAYWFGPWFMWGNWWWICPLMMLFMMVAMMFACRFMGCGWHRHGN